MELAFYISGLVAVLATIGVITGTSPVHAVVYLIVSLIAVALVFFALGAPFVGALESSCTPGRSWCCLCSW